MLLVSKINVQGRERTRPSLIAFDCVFLTQENADTTLAYENEPSLEVYHQEAKIYSCVEGVVRITDDIPLLKWIPHFAMKMITGRRWKKSVAQFGQEEPISFVERSIQDAFVCHQDRTRIIVHITMDGNVLGRGWTRQILSDAWESTKWENLFDNHLHSVIAETQLTEKFIEDDKGTDLILPRMLAKKPLEVECRKLYVWSANMEAHGNMGSCPGYALLTLQDHVRMNSKED